MKQNHFSQLNRSSHMLKTLMAFCAFLVLQGTPLEGTEEKLSTDISEEIAAFDTSSLIQEQFLKEAELSMPVLKPHSYKSPFLAVGLSGLFPGLGHVYLGDMKTAGGLLGTTGLSVGAAAALNSREFDATTILLTVQNTWIYGMYAAYRDVRMYNGQTGYLYKMPTDSFADLALAPFSWSVLKKPEVWGGLLGSFALAAGVGYLAFSNDAHIHASLSSERMLSPLIAFPVGIGEEAFFRGFLQSQFSEWSTPVGGIILSSIMFGAAHIPNAWSLEVEHRRNYYTFVVPLLTAFGIYDGWLTYKNHSLKESVALHAWYDFLLFTIGAVAGEASITGNASFALEIPF